MRTEDTINKWRESSEKLTVSENVLVIDVALSEFYSVLSYAGKGHVKCESLAGKGGGASVTKE